MIKKSVFPFFTSNLYLLLYQIIKLLNIKEYSFRNNIKFSNIAFMLVMVWFSTSIKFYE